MLIPLHDLRTATNGFSVDSRIGKGGYGDVYKGVYNERDVAVKLLHVDTLHGIDDQQYINEVGNLLRIKHPNIVQLLGYSCETKSELVENNGKRRLSQHIYRVLCFEYLQGGSLDKRLSGTMELNFCMLIFFCVQTKQIYQILFLVISSLSTCVEESFAPHWSTRYMIIKGICEGLAFLHRCEPPIFHLDLKPANILLDSFMVPKVADFGLSRVISQSRTHVTEQIRGTRMYMPPEFLNDGHISHKNDVYSLGIVMIEIMTGSSGYSSYTEMDEVAQFKHKVYTNWKNMIEPTSQYPSEELHQVHTCINTAMCCVEPDRNNRPTIADVLDILNKTETHIPKRQWAGVTPCPIIGPNNTMANTLKEMITELENITNQDWHSGSMPDNSSNVQQVTDIRETISDVEEELIIGRTDEMEEIVATLCGSITPENRITVLPIYGIGGIGKTTLAQLVFNDSRFAGYSRVWIYVSQNLDLNKIGNSIISQLSVESHVTNKQMINKKLRELFAGKKILIVLDDVWETNPLKLKDLKAMLRFSRGSMVPVIVTTRDEAIAREICHSVEPYKLETLTDKLCWKIIKQQTAFKDRVDKQQLKLVGREIAAKCGGVALAAQSLGYTLKGKPSDEWESVRDNYIWNLSTSEEPSSIDHQVLASLLLSYTRMPDWLKLCFSYCAFFPKGHTIAKHDLIHQWIALGFTEPCKIFDTLQLCEKYVTQLLGMSFLQYSKTSLGDRTRDSYVTLFTVHDLVHDLAKEILAHQINTGGNKCRYALLTDCNKSLQLSFPANIKALHFRDCGKQELCGDAFSPAKFLCVLDLSECFIKKLPDCIGQLKQLRFLHAPWIRHKSIPDCITELSKLNYLNLRGSHKISALPKLIGDMTGLMHLDLSGCYGLRELPISFTELKQLVYLDLSGCNMSTAEAFGGFTKLQYLNLSCAIDPDADNIKGLPEFIGNLTKLRCLNLSWCMDGQSKDHVGSLLGSISTFYNLEHLDLSYNKELSSIPESIGNLRKLHTLNLSGCFNLEKLPNCMDQMVSLKVLIVGHQIKLDECALSRLNFAPLPHFVVHASSDKCSSNISLLQPTNPSVLEIDRLENVKYAEEAHGIKLIEKRQIEELSFQWTVGAERFVDDKEVLEKLVPPSSVRELHIKGYRSDSFPDWLMDMRRYIPNLSQIDLCGFPDFPLGQLPNLRLFLVRYMEGLEEWEWNKACGEGADERIFNLLVSFPNFPLEQRAKLSINQCLPRDILDLKIKHCDYLLSSWGESSSHSGASSSSPKAHLTVTGSKVPMHEWRLLHHLPALHELTIVGCSDLTTSPEIMQRLSSLKSLTLYCANNDQSELPRWLGELTSLQQLNIDHSTVETLNEDIRELTQLESLRLSRLSMTSLPEWLGELTSLKNFELWHCMGISTLPDSIQQLTKLNCLTIRGCPTLVEWCESEENKMKLAHIREKDIYSYSDEEEESDEEDIFNDPDFSGEDIADGSDEEDASDEEDIAERVAC